MRDKTLLIAAWAVMALAGCAAAHTTTGPVPAASGTTAPTTPRERAVAEAAAILRAFAVPPGGQRLPDALKFPSSTLVSTALVDDVSFWRAPGRPQAVLAWEQAHLPRGFTPEDASFGPPSWDRTFSLTPVPGVLNARDLVVEVAGAGHGQTVIRVDAQVSWQPPRPAPERVPSAARAADHRLVHPAGPQAGRPELEGPLGRHAPRGRAMPRARVPGRGTFRSRCRAR